MANGVDEQRSKEESHSRRPWYKTPMIVLVLYGTIIVVPVLIATVSEIRSKARIAYAVGPLGVGRLDYSVPEDRNVWVWTRYCDTSPCEEAESPPVTSLIDDDVEALLLEQLIEVAPRVDAAIVCLENRSTEPSDSVALTVSVPGWLIGAEVVEIDETGRTALKARDPDWNTSAERLEIRQDKLEGKMRLEAFVVWVPYLEDPMSWADQLPLETLIEYLPSPRGSDDRLKFQVGEGGRRVARHGSLLERCSDHFGPKRELTP